MNCPDKPRKTPAAAGVRINCVGFLCLLCCLASVDIAHGQAIQLADIGQYESIDDNEYSDLITGIDRMFFVGFKSELWTSKPAADNSNDTRLIRKFRSISNLTVAGRTLYFIADDGVSGPELWKTDAATASGASKVKDIRPGAQGSNIRWMTNVYGTLYFSANDGKQGQELWRSNGGAANTFIVKDILPGNGSSSPTSLTQVNSTLYFSANDGVHGYELWKSAGTAASTVMIKDIVTESGISSLPDKLANVNGTVFFTAQKSGIGRELWRSDGTAEGTTLVKDIRPGSLGSGIDNTTAVYRTLFFSATDGIHGHELWKSDGTASGTVLVKDMTPGSQGSQGGSPGVSFIGNFTNIYGTLFFTAARGSVPYIWKTNGTAVGTVALHETWGQDESSPPAPQFVWTQDLIFFIWRNYPDATYSLMTMNKDGYLQAYVLDFDVNLSEHAPYHPELIRLGGEVYVSGKLNYAGFKIARTFGWWDGTGTIDIDIRNVGSDPKAFVQHNDLLYFIADHRYYEQDDLWVTDGTPEGTREIYGFDSEIAETEVVGNFLYSSTEYVLDISKTDLNTGMTDNLLTEYGHGQAQLLTNVNDSLHFITERGKLWKTNGTSTGTRIINEFYSIRAMHALRDALLFRVVLEDGTEELWRTSVSTSAISRLKTLHTGMVTNAASYPSATIGDTHYFVANDGIHGNELWKSRGTGASTSMVIDLNTGESGDAIEDDIATFIVFKNTLFFNAKRSDGIWSLYKSNGTATGTQRIMDAGRVLYAVVHADRLYFFTDEPNAESGGRITALWTTDGTAEGTTRIYDLEGASGKFYHKLLDEWLYFTVSEGTPLWRTDGTTCGTAIVNTGTQGAYPIEAINSTLIFGSEANNLGQEPYAFDTNQIPDAPCGMESSGSAMLSMGETGIRSYPNPFTSEVAFRIDGENDEFARLKVMTLAGYPIEDIEELRVNVDHTLGKSWAPGVYLMQVQMKNTVRTHLVVKK